MQKLTDVHRETFMNRLNKLREELNDYTRQMREIRGRIAQNNPEDTPEVCDRLSRKYERLMAHEFIAGETIELLHKAIIKNEATFDSYHSMDVD